MTSIECDVDLRLARTSLALFGEDGPFEIAYNSVGEMAAAQAAFEKLGCAVDLLPSKRLLVVTPR